MSTLSLFASRRGPRLPRATRGGGPARTRQGSAQAQARCPQAGRVCSDLQPVAAAQTGERDDALHGVGFSVAVFDPIAACATRWVEKIATIAL